MENDKRLSVVVLTFSQEGEWEAYHAAQAWLKAGGFSWGQGQRGAPCGILFGDIIIAKWKNLTLAERRGCHGELTGDHRNGPVTVTIFADAPPEAVRAAQANCKHLDATHANSGLFLPEMRAPSR